MTPTTTRGRPQGARRLLGRLLGESAPDQGPTLPASPRTLPGWVVGSRVHGQTRLQFGTRWDGEDQFVHAAEGFKKLGAQVFTRHVKSAAEDPPWPTALPVRLSDGRPLSDGPRLIHGVTVEPGRDVASEIIGEAKAQDMRIVVYYWHMSEASISDPHPDVEPNDAWVCKDTDGVAIEHDPRGTYLDITGPYREVVLQRLLELADRGADGFNFDERHLPPEGCWGSSLAAAWEAEKGVEAPPPDESNELYLKFLDFKARKIEDTFLYWRNEVKAQHPNVVFAVSTTTIAALTSREMTTRLARIADMAKNEYRLAVNPAMSKGVFPKPNEDPTGKLDPPPEHVRQALGWTVLRDSADGRPPRIWAPGLPTVDHAQGFAASLLTFGCIAHMDVDDRSVYGRPRPPQPHEGKTPLAGIRKAFELGDLVSPHLADVQPLRWAAVHFSEQIRNKRKAEYADAWREVLWPLVGAFQVLSEDGLPVGVVNDEQLDHGSLSGYQLLFLPNPDELTNVQQQRVQQFKAGGGFVIGNHPDWVWSDPELRAAAAAGLRKALAPRLGTAPLLVRGGPRACYGVAYRAPNKLVVAVTNDFGWVQVTRPPKNTNDPDDDPGEDDEEPPVVINDRAPAATDVEVLWRRGHGLPQSPLPTKFHRLRAIDAVNKTALPVSAFSGGYRVRLPQFDFMALLVVTPAPSPIPLPRLRRREPG